MLKKTFFAILVLASLAVPAAFAAEEENKEKAPAAAEATDGHADDAHDGHAHASEVVEDTTADAAESAVEGRLLLSQKLPHDIVIGDEKALITLTEYASLSCSHCRDFYLDAFEKLKTNYLDTGKVRLVYRHYPLNLNALRAAMILECGVTDETKKHTFLGAMFQSQPEWAYKEEEGDMIKKLKSIAKLGGIDDSKFEECAKNKDLEDAMLRQQLQTQKALGVNATPSFYINNKKYFDKKDYETVAKALDDAIANFGNEAPEADASDAKAE